MLHLVHFLSLWFSSLESMSKQTAVWKVLLFVKASWFHIWYFMKQVYLHHVSVERIFWYCTVSCIGHVNRFWDTPWIVYLNFVLHGAFKCNVLLIIFCQQNIVRWRVSYFEWRLIENTVFVKSPSILTLLGRGQTVVGLTHCRAFQDSHRTTSDDHTLSHQGFSSHRNCSELIL